MGELQDVGGVDLLSRGSVLNMACMVKKLLTMTGPIVRDCNVLTLCHAVVAVGPIIVSTNGLVSAGTRDAKDAIMSIHMIVATRHQTSTSAAYYGSAHQNPASNDES
mmetsp:Transcript_9941/g.21239  ORF Transcript_9941/g.21239 Transcript_9941/m.21239 type:complete len:107 (-) Transcript_9941:56-376(-)